MPWHQHYNFIPRDLPDLKLEVNHQPKDRGAKVTLGPSGQPDLIPDTYKILSLNEP